jgi:hypothetical protein
MHGESRQYVLYQKINMAHALAGASFLIIVSMLIVMVCRPRCVNHRVMSLSRLKLTCGLSG